MFHGLWGLRAEDIPPFVEDEDTPRRFNLGQHVDFGTVIQIGQTFEEATTERDDIYTRKYPI